LMGSSQSAFAPYVASIQRRVGVIPYSCTPAVAAVCPSGPCPPLRRLPR